jgi:hypothetical protein
MELEVVKAARREVSKADARVRAGILKRARKHGLSEAEAVELAEGWKRAARPTKRLHTAGDQGERAGANQPCGCSS